MFKLNSIYTFREGERKALVEKSVFMKKVCEHIDESFTVLGMKEGDVTKIKTDRGQIIESGFGVAAPYALIFLSFEDKHFEEEGVNVQDKADYWVIVCQNAGMSQFCLPRCLGPYTSREAGDKARSLYEDDNTVIVTQAVGLVKKSITVAGYDL